MDILELIKNLTVLIALSLLCTFIIKYGNMAKRTGQILAGILFGGVAGFGILYSYILETGVIFDGRSVILPMAGIFAGWPAALLAAIISTTARLIVGGAGIVPGLLTIAIASAGGIVIGILRKKYQAINYPTGFLFSGFIIHVLVVGVMVTLPPSSRSAFFNTIMPVFLIIFPLGFTLLALLLNFQEKNKATIEELYSSEQKHQLLADLAFEAILITDGERIIHQNHAARNMLGYDLEELNRITISNIVLPQYRESFSIALSKPTEMPVRIVLKNKEDFEILLEVQTRIISQKSRLLIAIAMRDISEKQLAKEELQHSVSLFREAEKVAHLGHWEYNMVKKQLYVSDEFYHSYSLTKGIDLVSVSRILRQIHPDDRRRVFDIYNNVMKTGKVETFENKIICKDNTVKYLRQGIYCQVKGGKTIRIFGIAYDISDQIAAKEKAIETQRNLEKMVESRTLEHERSRKAAINLLMDANEQRQRAENALKQLEKSHAEILKLSQAVEQSPAAVAITNTDGVVEYVNQTFVEFTGYDKDEIRGQKLNILRSPETNEDFYEGLWSTIKKGQSWKGEFHNRHKSGRLYWESVVISPIFNEKNEIVNFVKVAQDISDRKALEKDLIEARDRANLATRAKSEFLANMSHEIRTPMNAILGFADLLSYSLTDSRSIDYVESLKISGKNLLNLINDILDLSKVEAGMLKISKDFVSFRQLIREINQIFFYKATEKGLKLHLNVEDNFPEFMFTDETRLRQILLNLVSNALKYTETGEVTLCAKAGEPRYPASEDTTQQQGDITISVKDTGIGMSESFQEVLFESFTQEEGHDRKKQSGTGLGLAITKNLVTLLGGTISVTSKQGEGSTFNVYFPRVIVSDNQFQKEVRPELNWEDVRFEESTVLVVDDVDDNLKFLSRMLEYAGINVITAASAEEALNILKYETPNLIISDIRMPGMDGLEMFDIIRKDEKTKNIPVVASSASMFYNQINEELLSRFDGYLLKPIKTSELIHNLMKFLPNTLLMGAFPQVPEISGGKEIPNGEIPTSLLNILEEKAMPLWENLKDRQPLKKVEEFGQLLVGVGENWENDSLVGYGNEILQSRKSFNIEGMVRLIRQFPEMVGKMNKKSQSGHE